MSDTQSDIQKTDPKALAAIMDVDRDAENLWRTREMGSILRHQLAAPVVAELRSVRPQLAAEFTRFQISHDETFECLGDLFRHPTPPLKLLKLTKAFAKASRQDPDNPLPKELSTLLYFLSIVLAKIHWDKRITSLPDQQVRKGCRWGINQDWVEADMQQILQEGAIAF